MRGVRTISTLLALLLPVQAMASKAIPAELIEGFVAVMAGNGCMMTSDQAKLILPRAGFNAKEMRPIILKLIKDGHAEMTGEDDTLTISKEICQ